jgi:hypothetical protein
LDSVPHVPLVKLSSSVTVNSWRGPGTRAATVCCEEVRL